MRESVAAMLGWATGDGRVAWLELRMDERVDENLRRQVSPSLSQASKGSGGD